ncbi:unnamed protein product [Sphenostylis stenocarpa]|uniref:Uncharacterized protein n=1 Tax=Sphenostylis stenocarpa TaxID=92480 RepID=A0AA86TM29_9FABA|nr:unnamed protein product [Sphenostylis stenocarpa]
MKEGAEGGVAYKCFDVGEGENKATRIVSSRSKKENSAVKQLVRFASHCLYAHEDRLQSWFEDRSTNFIFLFCRSSSAR